MQYRRLGDSGLQVSSLALGSFTFGGQLPPWDARQVMDQYFHAGGNFIDTANYYNNGQAEEIIGQWLTDSRSRYDVVVGTKTYVREDLSPNHMGLSRTAILYSVEQSLRRLQTDYIDLYYPNFWDAQTPLEETLYALEMLVQSGKVRYVACSNYLSWQVQKALNLQERQGWSPFIAVQAQYSLMERGVERELMSLIQEEGIGLVVWSPLAGGFLTGKFAPDMPLKETTRLGNKQSDLSRFYRDLCLNERGWRIVDAVRELAEAYDAAPLQIALAWVASKPGVCSVVLGVSALKQIDENLKVQNIHLLPEDIQHLDAVSEIELGYPRYMQTNINRWR